uniref:Uncharacterized protein n=1 Tax=Setaria viridis TaxID=4556 RepID=A0A4U6T0A8_SETVI|nr:hypothetical protein SEVIR_9G287950v2 [Setaria viridis]
MLLGCRKVQSMAILYLAERFLLFVASSVPFILLLVVSSGS